MHNTFKYLLLVLVVPFFGKQNVYGFTKEPEEKNVELEKKEGFTNVITTIFIREGTKVVGFEHYVKVMEIKENPSTTKKVREQKKSIPQKSTSSQKSKSKKSIEKTVKTIYSGRSPENFIGVNKQFHQGLVSASGKVKKMVLWSKTSVYNITSDLYQHTFFYRKKYKQRKVFYNQTIRPPPKNHMGNC
ncbi:MAG: hypothetical protein ACK5IC_08835 [Moheibacter sp.]